MATSSGNIETKLIIDEKKQKELQFIEAARQGNWSTVKLLIEEGVSVNVIDNFHGVEPQNINDNYIGMTALHYAMSYASIEICKTLIDKKAEINAKTKNGATVLVLGIINNAPIQKISLLLENRADPNIPYGINSPLSFCVRDYSSISVIQLLLSHGAIIREKGAPYSPDLDCPVGYAKHYQREYGDWIISNPERAAKRISNKAYLGSVIPVLEFWGSRQDQYGHFIPHFSDVCNDNPLIGESRLQYKNKILNEAQECANRIAFNVRRHYQSSNKFISDDVVYKTLQVEGSLQAWDLAKTEIGQFYLNAILRRAAASKCIKEFAAMKAKNVKDSNIPQPTSAPMLHQFTLNTTTTLKPVASKLLSPNACHEQQNDKKKDIPKMN